MIRTVSRIELVHNIATYLCECEDSESLIEMYESMFPNVKVVYYGDNTFTVRSES